MNQLDLYYRAFLEYRKLTANDKECARQRNLISHTNQDADKLESIRIYCEIKEDWINEIEKGLVFVEKAIAEARQFIRSDGEVVPIEKAKRVSKHSVEHLAKHSEYITRLPEETDDDLVPDKLFMLERDSDYAVYENRFLYMLLCYLDDFINMRLDKITELGNTYRARMEMQKNISLGKRNITYEARLSEERHNDPRSFLNKEALELVGRIEGIGHWVRALLSTPLMEQVAKVAMIRPPITKTNVLKMNNNFKGAVALYEYVVAYEGDGYIIEERKKIYSPFADTMADEFSELVLLSSFLAYEYGSDIKDELREAYEIEEERRRQEEQDKLASQISAMKKRIAESGESPDAYMLMLERRNKELEGDSMRLREEIAENQRLSEETERLEGERAAAERRIADMLDEDAQKEQRITALKKKFEDEVAVIREQSRVSLEEDRARLNAETLAVKNEYGRLSRAAEENADARVAEIQAENDRLREENTLVRAQLHGLRQQHGLMSSEDDFTSRERFEELEREYEAFLDLFEKQWKVTKRRIRKDILWTLKKKDGDGDSDK